MTEPKSISYLEGESVEKDAATRLIPWQRFSNSISDYPDRPALVSMHQSAALFSIPNLPLPGIATETNIQPYLRWSYRSLKSGIDRLAIALRRLGVVPGMPLVTFLPNNAEYVLSKMAAHMSGCPFAPLNPRNLVNAEEVVHILKLFLLHARIKRIVIVAENETVAESIDRLGVPELSDAVKIVATASGPDGWRYFTDLMEETADPAVEETSLAHSPSDEMLLCTSGTTSQPKLCALTTSQVSWTAESLSQRPRHDFSSEDAVLCVAPNNHVAGNEAVLCALSFGGAVVFPSARFDADAFIRAAKWEKATFTVLVPTMVLALCRGRTEKIANFRSLFLGGSPVTRDVLRLCVDVLGCKDVCPVFGSTEGAFVRTGDRCPEELLGGSDDGYAPVGWGAAPGQRLKVCEVGDRNAVLPLGSVGELHISSPGVVTGYVGVSNNDQFYLDDAGLPWYNTGDQARIDADGRVYVLGRYKDMIIRGGENISPAAIEAVLEPTLGHLGIQVVGAADDDGVAGEVPVVVTKDQVDADTAAAIRKVVVQRMGPAFAPDEVLSLHELGLADYPRTTVGKVQKHKLAVLVRDYRTRRNEQGNRTSPYPEGSNPGSADISGAKGSTRSEPPSATENIILKHLTRVWSQTIGIYDEERFLSPDTAVSALPVDSIAVMRVRDRLAKALGGRTLSLAELSKTGTIREQAALLDSKALEAGHVGSTITQNWEGPPGVDDMVHLTEDASLFDHTKELVSKAIQGCGLTWDKNVRAVMPTSDFNTVSLRVGSMYHLNLKMVVLTSNNTSKEQLRAALHRVIMNNPMMASFIVADAEKLGRNVALHVQVNLDRDFLDRFLLGDGGVVKKTSELLDFAKRQHFPGCRDAVPPGPLSKLWLFNVEESNSAAFVLNACHSIYDASFTQLVYEDLEQTLADPSSPLRPHTDYRLWADSYFTLRSSPAARAAVAYHTRALQGLHNHKHAIWPPHPPVYAPRKLNLPSDGDRGVVKVFDVPGWLELRGVHPDVIPPVPLKAAFSLFLRHKTGHTHAMFAQVESERGRWPFLPKSFGDYPASDVGGLTIQTVNNLVSIAPNETVIAFLKRMGVTQALQTKHASAPRALVMDSLGPESAELYPWLPSAATFNWVGANMPSSKDQFKRFEVVDVVLSREMFGFFLMGGMIATESGVKLWIKIQGATFGLADLGPMADELQRLTQWLVKEDNWERGMEQHEELYQ